MRKTPYIAVMIALIGIYLLGQYYVEDHVYIDIISTVLAIIAAVAFWMEFRSNERINEAQLIMELNDQFVTNPQFTHVEWVLEKYYNAYKEAKRTGQSVDAIPLEINLEIANEERQYLINYLVHLEGMAALVNEGVLHLKVISNLMAYRYFIAVNNPIVQKHELLPYKEYYRGIFSLYEKWSKEIGEENVPMGRNGLIEQKV